MIATNWLPHSTPIPKSATRREAPATAPQTTMAGHLTQQQQLFQILHGNHQAHMIYNRVQRGATGAPSAASAAEDPKRALVHALQNDLSRMSVLLERLDELLSA